MKIEPSIEFNDDVNLSCETQSVDVSISVHSVIMNQQMAGIINIKLNLIFILLFLTVTYF